MCQSQSSNLSLFSLPPPSNYKFIFYICNSISIWQISSFIACFYSPHMSDIYLFILKIEIWLTYNIVLVLDIEYNGVTCVFIAK